MKNLLKTLPLAFVALVVGACSNPETNSDLKATITPVPVIGLPVAIYSCTDTTTKSIAKVSVKFTTFKFQWLGDNKYEAQYILLTLYGSNLQGGKQSIFLAGTDLEAAFYNGSFTKVVIDGKDNTEYTSSCGLRFGGLKFVDPKSETTVTGTILIYGTQTDKDGIANEVITEVPVTVNYKGDPSL